MDITGVMRTFEESFKGTGLPEPPKLSEVFSSEEELTTDVEDTAIKGRPEITAETQSHWITLPDGREKYIHIPKKAFYDVGKDRCTIMPKEEKKTFTVAETLKVVESPKPVYSGVNLELKKPTKPKSWQESITANNNTIHYPSKNIVSAGGNKAVMNLQTAKIELKCD